MFLEVLDVYVMGGRSLLSILAYLLSGFRRFFRLEIRILYVTNKWRVGLIGGIGVVCLSVWVRCVFRGVLVWPFCLAVVVVECKLSCVCFHLLLVG